MIVGTENEILSSLKILFAIEKSVNYSAVESTNEYNALVDALSNVQSIRNEFDIVIANATVDSEVILARGANTTLKERLDNVDTQLNEIENDKAEKTDVGLLSGLLTTAKTSIVAAINELFNSKANKTQEAWITPTLLNGATGTIRYRKNQFGRLEFGGKVTGTNGLPCLQTVSGYRPIGSNVFLSAVKTDITATRFIILTTAGELYLGAPNGTYEVDMNGISINI